MDFVPIAAMLTLVIAIINFAKYIRAGDKNGIVTSLSVWTAGVVVVLLVGQTDFADTIVVADRALGTYNFWSQFFIGLSISTIGQFANDVRAALDSGDTSRKPPLVADPPQPSPEQH